MSGRDAPSVTALARRATSPVSLRATGEEKPGANSFSPLARSAGEGDREAVEGARHVHEIHTHHNKTKNLRSTHHA
jgi:hypothetical protein